MNLNIDNSMQILNSKAMNATISKFQLHQRVKPHALSTKKLQPKNSCTKTNNKITLIAPLRSPEQK